MALDQPTNYTTCDAVKKAQVETGSTQVSWPGCQSVGLNDDHHRQSRSIAIRSRCASGDLSIVQLNARGGGDRYSFYVSGDRNIEQGVFFNSDNSQKSVRTQLHGQPERQARLHDQRQLAGWAPAPSDPGRVGERPCC